jgi:fumarylacetoacetase
MPIDFTHNAAAVSWVLSANEPDTDFPLQNLPYCVFRRRNTGDPFRGGVGIGEYIVDLSVVQESGLLDGVAAQAAAACSQPTLNDLLALGPTAWQALRHALFNVLHSEAPPASVTAARNCLVRQDDAEYDLPIRIGDYTDYFTSIHHAINGGRLLGPDYKLARSFQWLPMAYHGRASSIGVAGLEVRRPHGQVLDSHSNSPVFRPTRRLDFELELGIVIGTGSSLGEPVGISAAEDHVFGLCLLNDWSARDIQAWEMTPLGPFQSKNFATTIAPWIVTLDALAPFRSPLERVVEGPDLLPYLDSEHVRLNGALDIHLQVSLETAAMRAGGLPPKVISRTNFVHQYWTVSQMVTHHTAGGCNLQIGDLLGTGTISGPQPKSAGAMIELSSAGQQPLRITSEEERSFLEDGDRVIFNGWCERAGSRRIGFGVNDGIVLPAIDLRASAQERDNREAHT